MSEFIPEFGSPDYLKLEICGIKSRLEKLNAQISEVNFILKTCDNRKLKYKLTQAKTVLLSKVRGQTHQLKVKHKYLGLASEHAANPIALVSFLAHVIDIKRKWAIQRSAYVPPRNSTSWYRHGTTSKFRPFSRNMIPQIRSGLNRIGFHCRKEYDYLGHLMDDGIYTNPNNPSRWFQFFLHDDPKLFVLGAYLL